MITQSICRSRLRVRGQVQGVGFRPYVYRLARRLGLDGFVANDQRGAIIEVQGPPQVVAEFSARLLAELPPLAQVSSLDQQTVAPTDSAGFQIRPSQCDGQAEARVTIDSTVCQACLAEMNDPADRRYLYPFINCTDCGPRYSIVERIPYDRPNTTMRDFGMCPACRAEYEEPGSRRFHAQPIACPRCGPQVWLADPAGRRIAGGNPIGETVERLLAGQIIAIKGLGGFHLACRADRDEPVRELRRRKKRDHKPFAIMVRDLAAAQAIALLDEPARALLTGIDRPIVLLPKGSSAPISQSVAPGTNCFGLMLPYTPLHYLLFGRSMPALVMTSGNISDEPLCKDNDEAIERLGPLCDAMLLHDRRIERRIDDSVIRSGGRRWVIVRRSRGHVPRPVALHPPADRPILAVGAELKNTICLARGDQAVLSEHIGDLTDASVYGQFARTIDHLAALMEVSPAVVAHDLHPLYLSTRYARQRSELQAVGIQHHWAHVVSCLAEHGLAGPVIGIACDGTGYGTDGASWGCEVLRADRRCFERLGHLQYFRLPGGDAAARQLHRAALALLHQTFGDRCGQMAVARRVCPDAGVREVLLQMLAGGVNCPASSSLGRLFDAVACMLGVADVNHFEGQAPMALEAVADPKRRDYYPHAIERRGSRFELDVRPVISAIVAELEMGRDPAIVAAKFHNTVVELLAAAALMAREITGLNDVVLSGGCFVNRYLTERLTDRLEQAGLAIWTHQRVPCNDGGIALGQAAVAAAWLADQGH